MDFKRASFASQKGVNWKPINALFICGIRILFTNPLILTKAIENLKGRSMRKSIVLLLPYLQLTRQLVYLLTCQLNNRSPVTLSFNYPVYKQLVNLSSRYLVYQIIVLLLLCLSSTLSTSNSLPCLLVNLSTKQNLTLSFVLLITHYRPSSHKETYSREGK